MTSTTRALLARLDVYRDNEECPAPPPPPPHPQLKEGVALVRRMDLCVKRQKALEEENNELRGRLQMASRSSTAPDPHALVGGFPLLGYRQVLEECCSVFQSGEAKLHHVSFVRSAVVRALEGLYALKAFAESFDALNGWYRDLKKEGIQLVLEHRLGDLSSEKARVAAAEVLMRFESIEERLARWTADCDFLQGALRDNIGATVARAVLHVGSVNAACCCHHPTSPVALLCALQEAALGVLTVTNQIEADVTGFKRNSNADEKLVMRLHAMSLNALPQHAALSVLDVQAMACERIQPDVERQGVMNTSSYDTVERSLQTALSLLDS